MLIAVVSVSLLIWLTLGGREAVVVLVAIPVTLALTLFVFCIYGYTLNRITLFALIFSIGILVDDAIVVVENIVRHARLSTGESSTHVSALAVKAVDEVGNPTILATLTVIAAILPMAFVGGLMGPYMRPDSGRRHRRHGLLARRGLRRHAVGVRKRLLRNPDTTARRGGPPHELYRRWMSRLLIDRRSCALAFLVAWPRSSSRPMALVPLKLVTVKMLPFDNKSEFQVIMNMPDGTPLEETARVADELARRRSRSQTVTSVQTYVGTSSPYNFNGLVRHYFLRRGPHQADLQVNLLPKEDRSEQSHDIAKRVREALAPIAQKAGARIKVAEVPPGPPVLQTLVAEVYGPDPQRRLELARQVQDIFEQTPGVVDVDWYVESPQSSITVDVDTQKAAAAGVTAAAVAALARMAGAGEIAGHRARRRGPERHPDRAAPAAGRRAGRLDALRSVRISGASPAWPSAN